MSKFPQFPGGRDCVCGVFEEFCWLVYIKIFLVDFFAASVSLQTFSAAPCGVFLVFTIACGVVEFL